MGQFDVKPKTIEEIGKETFLTVPFYKRNRQYNVIYINPEIYSKIFNKKYNYEEAVKDINEKFCVTLVAEDDKREFGQAYIDKQGDPTDIALNGNKGSGRAFYLYGNCNIKGEKTPFATSPRDDYNNGKYALDCAIQEALISNVLNSEEEFDNFQTLAIIDLEEEYLFPHTNGKLPCGLIIRYYEDKELYRFSHRFVNNKSFSKKELYNIANKIGELEGNKFIKRFLHGAWSIGNLSIESNMIDLDTSFYVIGRHPQWSFTDKFITNYFGYEYKGQIMVLETVLNSDLNIEQVRKEDIQKIIEEERIKTIRKGFATLIGYDDIIYSKYKKQFDSLADDFNYLSQIIYDNYDNLNCVDANCQNTYLFDFSNFFRYYEISKQNGSWNKMYGLQLLLNENAKVVDYSYDDEEYHEKILGFFSDIIVKNEEMYFDVMIKAVKFIENFEILNTMIDKIEKINKNNKLIKAYLENENKTYLTARKWIRGEVIDLYNKNGAKCANELMNFIINCYSKKDYKKNVIVTDLVIFEEGVLYRELSDKSNKFVFKLYDDLDVEELVLFINENKIVLKRKNDLTFSSCKFPNTEITKMNNVYIVDSKQQRYFTQLGRDVENIQTNKGFAINKKV